MARVWLSEGDPLVWSVRRSGDPSDGAEMDDALLAEYEAAAEAWYSVQEKLDDFMEALKKN